MRIIYHAPKQNFLLKIKKKKKLLLKLKKFVLLLFFPDKAFLLILATWVTSSKRQDFDCNFTYDDVILNPILKFLIARLAHLLGCFL